MSANASGIRRVGARAGFLAFFCAFGFSHASAEDLKPAYNDYPTEARADYVFGCMASNGQSRDVLRRCSCSIDVIASIIPYDKYVEAETVLSLQLVGGERMSIFRTAATTKSLVADLRRAQAEADILCF